MAEFEYFEQLPDNTVYEVMRNMPYGDIINLCASSKSYQRLCATSEFQKLLRGKAISELPTIKRFIREFILDDILSEIEPYVQRLAKDFDEAVKEQLNEDVTLRESIKSAIASVSPVPQFIRIEGNVWDFIIENISEHLVQDGIFAYLSDKYGITLEEFYNFGDDIMEQTRDTLDEYLKGKLQS